MTEGDAARIREIRIVGATAFTESTLLGLFELTHAGLADLVHQVRPLLARQAQRRPGDAARLLRQPRLPRVRRRVDPGHDLAGQAGHLDRDLDPRRSALHRHRRAAGGRLPGQGRRVPRAGAHASPASPTAARTSPTTQAPFADLLRPVRLCLRARRRAARDRPRQRPRSCVVLAADPQRRVYVRRIDVAGNTRTRDEVDPARVPPARVGLVRRRAHQAVARPRRPPGLLQRGRGRDAARCRARPTRSTWSSTVKEKPTGNLLLGAGFSSAEKLSLTASIKQDNVFGSGNYLGVELNTSKHNAQLRVQHRRPVLHDRRHLARDRRLLPHQPALQQPGRRLPDLTTPGASIRFGVPFSEFDTVFFGIGCERTEIGATTGIPNSYFLYRAAVRRNQHRAAADAGLGARRARQRAGADRRAATSASTSSASLFGDVRYLRTNLQFQQYLPLPAKLSLGLNAELGCGKGLGGRPYPLFKNFYGGGLGSVRVLRAGLARRRRPDRCLHRRRASASTSTPSSTCRCRARATTSRCASSRFADAGNVWREGETIDASSAARVGRRRPELDLAGRPAEAELGHAGASRSRNDRIQKFQFQIGTAF